MIKQESMTPQQFALLKHGDQKYGDFPYSKHLQDVVRIVEAFSKNFSDNELKILIPAAWLHDVLEDTRTTMDELDYYFGYRVADLVFAVTDEPGKNRKERKLNTYAKIRNNSLAIGLKLADRIANVENCLQLKNIGLLEMYRKEHEEFKKQLKFKDEYQDMWDHLDWLIQDAN
jgi:(p)ppGpp synthase/HD superfamily hydrolase